MPQVVHLRHCFWVRFSVYWRQEPCFLQERAIERSENTLDILLVLVLRLWTPLDWRRGRRSVHAGQAAGDKKRVTV